MVCFVNNLGKLHEYGKTIDGSIVFLGEVKNYKLFLSIYLRKMLFVGLFVLLVSFPL